MVICNTNIDQWNNLPESKSRVKKKSKKVQFLPAPDSVVVSSFREQSFSSGVVSTMNVAKEGLLTGILDKSKTTGFQSVNPEGYLTHLATMDCSIQEVQDLKKLRTLLKSLISTNPTQPQSWLAACRVEEKDNNIKAAKELMREACEKCPDSEDIWIEAARLELPPNAKVLLAKAAAYLPKSVKVWLALANLETLNEHKAKVLKKALEHNPESVRLWKEIVAISSEHDAKRYLQKAVICAPHSLELWLALAKLESYKDAKRTLNNARKQLPLELAIWICAARLEETEGNLENVSELIKRGIKTLKNSGVEFVRSAWLSEVVIAEKAGSLLTAKALLKYSMDLGLEGELQTYSKDLAYLQESDCKESFRYFSRLLIERIGTSKQLWKTLFLLENKFGDKDFLKTFLAEASRKSKSSKLWAEYLKIADASEVFSIFKSAMAMQTLKQSLYVIAYERLMQSFNYAEAEEVLQAGLQNCYCVEMVVEAMKFYKSLGSLQRAREIGEKAISDFPNEAKLYLKLSEIVETDEAKSMISNACTLIPSSGKLWIRLASLENNELKARYILEKGRSLSQLPCVFYESIEFELEKNNRKAAEIILNKALQTFPNDGRLWAYCVEMTEGKNKKTKIAEALQRNIEDPYLILCIAKLFHSERKFEKARLWLEKALNQGPWLGDVWIFYYKMEIQLGEHSKAAEILERSEKFSIRKGKIWKKYFRRGPNKEVILAAVV